MRHFMKRGAVALLDNEENNPAITDAAAPADNANSAETDLVEVADSAAVGEKEEADLAEAIDTQEALEQYKAALESFIGEGGVDQKGARLLQIGLEHMSNRVGFSIADRPNIAMESFGGASSKGRATQIALEGIGEQLKKVWASIVAAIKRIIDWVKDHFNKMFGAAEKLQKRAKAIAEKAKAVTGSADTGAKIENERLVKALHMSGKIANTPSGSLENVLTVANSVFGHVADFSAKSGEAALKALEATDGKVADIFSGPFTPDNGIKALSQSDAQAAGFEPAPAGLELYRSFELPGGKAVLGRYPSKATQGEDAVKALIGSSAALTAYSNKAAEPSGAALPTLASAEIGKVAEQVATLCGEIIAYKAKIGKADGIKKKILSAAEKLSKASMKEDDKDKAAFMSAQQKIAQASAQSIDKPAPQFMQYALVTGKAFLDYCEESLKLYK